MSIEQLAETARAMVAPGKGIIAIDESTNTIDREATPAREHGEPSLRGHDAGSCSRTTLARCVPAGSWLFECHALGLNPSA